VKKIFHSLLLLLLLHASGFAQIIEKLELPATKEGDKIITHSGYSFLYNETHEQATWVAYELTREETKKLFDRTDKFIPDPDVNTGTANNADYKESGYDRGHLAPAADMGWSSTSVAESFYFSNMSPQVPAFNRGIWKKLEEQVRDWAIENDAVYIVTGPVLSEGLPTIGDNKVSVPAYYYKIILDFREPEIKSIAFIIPNKGSTEQLSHYAVSIDSVEIVTGLDFFPLLPDEQEAKLEKTTCISCWSWNDEGDQHGEEMQKENKKADPANEPVKSGNAVQCSGTTQSGQRCHRMTTNANGRCYQH
jgi:endonuclease G